MRKTYESFREDRQAGRLDPIIAQIQYLERSISLEDLGNVLHSSLHVSHASRIIVESSLAMMRWVL